MDPQLIGWVVVIGSAIWVAADASKLGVSRGCLGGGMFDMGIAGWFFVTLLLWIVGFPAYLVHRRRYELLKQKGRVVLAGEGKRGAAKLGEPAELAVSPDNFCGSCGNRAEPGKRFCGSCGAEYRE